MEQLSDNNNPKFQKLNINTCKISRMGTGQNNGNILLGTLPPYNLILVQTKGPFVKHLQEVLDHKASTKNNKWNRILQWII